MATACRNKKRQLEGVLVSCFDGQFVRLESSRRRDSQLRKYLYQSDKQSVGSFPD